MSQTANQEIWQVEVGGQVYEADFAELATWVADGALQPEDKVRRGNLRWIEARRVPLLVAHFNAKRDGTLPPKVVVTVTDAAKEPVTEPIPTESLPAATVAFTAQPTSSFQVSNPDFCVNHGDRPTTYICRDCGKTYCKGCPSSYGGSVKICPACGALCQAKEQIKAASQKASAFQEASEKGFGFSDLANAVSYPFRFKFSLLVGAVMYTFFSLGRGASAMGGIFMVAASIVCLMLANMLTFGVLAHTTEEFSQGKTGGDFMPRFDEFSMWDDVVHPFFLSLGAYISSFGVFILVVLIGGYMVYTAISSQQQAMMSEIEKLPGTEYYKGKQTIQQSKEVEEVLNKVKKQNADRLQRIADMERGAETREMPANANVASSDQRDPNDGLRQLATSANTTAPAIPATAKPADDDGAEDAQKMIDQMRKKQLEGALGKTPETREKEQSEFIARFLSISAPLVVFAALALLWGLFYFPAACAVAGYTRSFTAAINPLVGLDTIKRLGFDYIKLLLMCFFIVIALGFVYMALAFIFAPFDLPGMGNLPAKVVESILDFYFWIVFCCLLGFLLFKSSDKLKLYK